MHHQSKYSQEPTQSKHPKIAFFGPPCSRKSTLIRCMGRILPNSLYVDIELADWGSGSAQAILQVLASKRVNAPVFVTASMFSPGQIPDPFKIVRLITKDETRYLQEVKRRAAVIPDKAGQDEIKHYRGMLKIPSTSFNADIEPWVEAAECDYCFTRTVLKKLKVSVPKQPPSLRCVECRGHG
jgi:hypothetical protein